MTNPEHYLLNVPEEALADLRQRLDRARFADALPGAPWSLGTDSDWLRSLVRYWRDDFDWRVQEARLNAWPQFKVAVNGCNLHYIHVEGKGPNPMPLLLSHGWPGSVFEFLEMIERLTDPQSHGGDPNDAFTVVIPSLPGYHLSYTPGQPAFSIEMMADCFAKLMVDVLGYQRFGAQGGDWGAFITSRLAHVYPERLTGIHLNLLPLPRDPGMVARTDEEAAYIREVGKWLKQDTGYISIQATRPQTLAFALNDSPIGLAAWIGEKFRTWSNPAEDLLSLFDVDALLANISLYWFTGSIGMSFLPYHARHNGTAIIPADAAIEVPTGYAEFPFEFLRPPRSLATGMFANLRSWTKMEEGGHFGAIEQPKALSLDVIAFFRQFRS